MNRHYSKVYIFRNKSTCPCDDHARLALVLTEGLEAVEVEQILVRSDLRHLHTLQMNNIVVCITIAENTTFFGLKFKFIHRVNVLKSVFHWCIKQAELLLFL